MFNRDPDPYGIQDCSDNGRICCATCGAEPSRSEDLTLCAGACGAIYCADDYADHICETPPTTVVEVRGPGDIRAMQQALSILTKRGLR